MGCQQKGRGPWRILQTWVGNLGSDVLRFVKGAAVCGRKGKSGGSILGRGLSSHQLSLTGSGTSSDQRFPSTLITHSKEKNTLSGRYSYGNVLCGSSTESLNTSLNLGSTVSSFSKVHGETRKPSNIGSTTVFLVSKCYICTLPWLKYGTFCIAGRHKPGLGKNRLKYGRSRVIRDCWQP